MRLHLYNVLAGLLLSTVLGEEYLQHGVHHPVHETHYQGSKHNVEFDHEAVLGSEQANEEYAELPPHEAKKRLATLIDKMDLDNDGFISEDELSKWIEHSFKELNKEETVRKMITQDTNRDLFITWPEYLESVYGYKPDDIIDMDVDKNPEVQTFMKMVNEDKQRMVRADVDQDSRLSVEEYTTFLHPYNFPHMQEYELDRNLLQYDKNNDKVVDFKEYVGDSPGSEEMQIVDKENFEHYDKDGDGVLSQEELRAWILPDLKDSVNQEVEHLFTETDINRDGRLDKQEILDMHWFWVGSAATDYGSQLHRHDPQEL